nr:5718_t:CDS:2 [Entrophospora candida]
MNLTKNPIYIKEGIIVRNEGINITPIETQEIKNYRRVGEQA